LETVNQLEVKAPIETFGQGARGFNVDTGTVRAAVFERLVTHADAAVGIQISQPIGHIAVRRVAGLVPAIRRGASAGGDGRDKPRTSQGQARP
jgi:hypothetical protein